MVSEDELRPYYDADSFEETLATAPRGTAPAGSRG